MLVLYEPKLLTYTKFMSGTHSTEKLNKKLKTGLVLNLAFTIFEFIVGFFSGSLALISDAGHNLTDSLSLFISYLGNRIAKRDANEEHTYGYGRATILSALINSLLLLGLAIFIFYEAYRRLNNPEPVNGVFVAVVALVGVVMNFSVAFLFKNEKDLNIRSAYMNMLFDGLASVGALIAGILMVITGQTIFDSLISIVIGLLLIKGGWGLVRKTIHILLEGVPEGIDTNKVQESILKNDSMIKDVDDLHIWAISSHSSSLSCHLVIEECDLDKSMQIVEGVKKMLKEKFDIEHATIETELIECLPEKGEM